MFSQLGRWKALKAGRQAGDDRRRRLRRLAGRRGDRQARALRRPGVRPADPAPPARADPRAPRHPASRRSTSASPRSRSSTACPSRAPKARAPSSRSWKAARSTARSAWCPTPAARKSAGRSRTCWWKSRNSPRRACARSTCSARTSMPIAGPYGDGEVADLGLLIRAIAEIDGIGRIRFTTSHPLEFSDSLIEAYRDVPQLANYLHLPVQAGSDRILAAMKRGYTALEFKQKIRKLRAVRPGHLDLVGLHRRLPRRDRCRLRQDHEADRGRRLRPVVLLHLLAPPRHAGRRPRGRHQRRGKACAAGAPAGAHQRASRRRSRRRWSAACSACWSKARRGRTPTN